MDAGQADAYRNLAASLTAELKEALRKRDTTLLGVDVIEDGQVVGAGAGAERVDHRPLVVGAWRGGASPETRRFSSSTGTSGGVRPNF